MMMLQHVLIFKATGKDWEVVSLYFGVTSRCIRQWFLLWFDNIESIRSAYTTSSDINEYEVDDSENIDLANRWYDAMVQLGISDDDPIDMETYCYNNPIPTRCLSIFNSEYIARMHGYITSETLPNYNDRIATEDEFDESDITSQSESELDTTRQSESELDTARQSESDELEHKLQSGSDEFDTPTPDYHETELSANAHHIYDDDILLAPGHRYVRNRDADARSGGESGIESCESPTDGEDLPYASAGLLGELNGRYADRDATPSPVRLSESDQTSTTCVSENEAKIPKPYNSPDRTDREDCLPPNQMSSSELNRTSSTYASDEAARNLQNVLAEIANTQHMYNSPNRTEQDDLLSPRSDQPLTMTFGDLESQEEEDDLYKESIEGRTFGLFD